MSVLQTLPKVTRKQLCCQQCINEQQQAMFQIKGLQRFPNKYLMQKSLTEEKQNRNGDVLNAVNQNIIRPGLTTMYIVNKAYTERKEAGEIGLINYYPVFIQCFSSHYALWTNISTCQ